jgi:Tol biopolymer transport system component
VSTIGDGTSAGGDSPSLSADGRWVAFQSAANNLVAGDTDGVTDIFVYDRQTDATGRVSLASNGIQSDAGSYSPSLSADGRWVAFESEASNLVANDTNKVRDIFVYDRQTGATERVSLASNGIQSNGESNSPRISANGRWVAFVSWANNLVTADTNDWSDIFVYDRQIGVI